MENRRENDRTFYEELRGFQEKISERFDVHAREGFDFHRKTEERLASVEANIGVMTDYVKRVTDILERLTVIEERDKHKNEALNQINAALMELKNQSSASKAEITAVDKKLSRWAATFSGAFAVLAVLWNLVSSSIDSKLTEYSSVMEKIKIHLEVDKPAGWPPSTNVK